MKIHAALMTQNELLDLVPNLAELLPHAFGPASLV